MTKTIFICDQCGKEADQGQIIKECWAWCANFNTVKPGVLNASLGPISDINTAILHYCEVCIAMVRKAQEEDNEGA